MSSSKLTFSKQALRDQLVAKWDERGRQWREEMLDATDLDRLHDRVVAWRAEQERRVSDLFSRLGGNDLSDAELAGFSVESMPETRPDAYSTHRLKEKIDKVDESRDYFLKRLEAMVADSEGNLSLTTNQLREFLGL